MIGAVYRNQILSDVTSSDHIVHSTSMVNRIQLKYENPFSMYNI